MFYNILVIIVRILLFPFYRIKVHNIENLPANQNIIVCANHWSMLDPIFLAISLPIKFNFMAKKELFESKILKAIFEKTGVFPVDRQGNDLKALRYSVNLIKENKTLGIFPEGTRVKSVDRANIKEGVAFIARKANADILPVEILTSYKLFSRVDLFIKRPIKIDYYKDYKNKEAMEAISEKIFKALYENRLEVESGKKCR